MNYDIFGYLKQFWNVVDLFCFLNYLCIYYSRFTYDFNPTYLDSKYNNTSTNSDTTTHNNTNAQNNTTTHNNTTNCTILASSNSTNTDDIYSASASEFLKIQVSIALMLAFLKALFFCRIFKSIGMLSDLLIKCVQDMRSFLIFFITFIMVFAGV